MRRFLLLIFVSDPALAGMPVITLSEIARLRLSGISFFLILMLLAAGGIRLIWNYLRRDFPGLPLLDFKRAIALVVLLGLCFNIVLLMIAGARELMTPGAWEKSGTTYQLKSSQR